MKNNIGSKSYDMCKGVFRFLNVKSIHLEFAKIVIFPKGPFINYVTAFLGLGGGSRKCFIIKRL